MNYQNSAFYRLMHILLRRFFRSLPLYVYRSDFPEGRLTGRPREIGDFAVIDYGGGVTIGKNVKVGFGAKILSASSITGSSGRQTIRKPVVIGNNVEIGSNAVVLPGVTIGDNSTIGAGAVVTEDICSNALALGVPAKVVKLKA